MSLLGLALSPPQPLSRKRVLRITGFRLKVYYKVSICDILLLLSFLLTSVVKFNFRILLLLCGDVEVNPGPKFARVLYTNIRGLHANIRGLSITANNYDVILCSETLTSNNRHYSELLIPNFGKPRLLHRSYIPRARGLAVYIRKGFTANMTPRFHCSCHEFVILKICGKHCNFYIFSAYRNPDLDDSIYDCFLDSMARIQESDRKSSFIFVGDMNAHHKDWLNSRTTDRHGIAALDFGTVTNCTQTVSDPTHLSNNTLDLLFTDVPDLVSTSVKPPVGTSDHCVIAFKVTTSLPQDSETFSHKVYLKNSVDWAVINSEVASLPWSSII